MSEEKAKKQPAKKKESAKKPSKKTKAGDENVVGEKSLVLIDYVAKTKDDGKIFDLTREDVAKEEGLYKEDGHYEPYLVAVGWNWLLAALEEELVGMKIGEEKTVEIPPDKGAGLKDPAKIKRIAKAKLIKQGARPVKGEEITFGRERGIVTADLGRTVRVDFNSPLAGKTLIFEVIVRKIISDPVEKLIAIVKRRVPALPEDKFKVSIKAKVVTIELPKETRYIQDIGYAEIGIAADALKVQEDAKEVKIVITYDRPEPQQDTSTSGS